MFNLLLLLNEKFGIDKAQSLESSKVWLLCDPGDRVQSFRASQGIVSSFLGIERPPAPDDSAWTGMG